MAVDGLGEGVAQGVADGPERRSDASQSVLFAVPDRRVLTAMI
jgi:hypothetical protein